MDTLVVEKELRRMSVRQEHLKEEGIRMEMRVTSLEDGFKENAQNIGSIKDDISAIHKMVNKGYYLFLGGVCLLLIQEFGLLEIIKKLVF